MINDKTQTFIEEYKRETSQSNVTITAWQFGTEPDELARLVVRGKKTATCSLYKLSLYTTKMLKVSKVVD